MELHTIQWRFARPTAPRAGVGPCEPDAIWNLLVSAAAALTAGVALFLPAAVWLPALSLVSLVGGGLVALFAWYSAAQRDSRQVTAWDVAGALVLIGFVAGMLSDPTHALQLFAVPEAPE